MFGFKQDLVNRFDIQGGLMLVACRVRNDENRRIREMLQS
jgi:hypothetical protein